MENLVFSQWFVCSYHVRRGTIQYLTGHKKNIAHWKDQNIIGRNVKTSFNELFFFFFIITMLVEEQWDLLIKKENNKIIIAMYEALVDTWETPVHMHRLPLAKTCLSIVWLEASPHPISICAECVGDGGAVCYWWIVFLFSLLPWKLQLDFLCCW
jgi:hypothetical protein